MSLARIAVGALAALVVVAAAGMAYVRLAPDDPALWHVDPMARRTTGKSNEFRVLPQGGDAVSEVRPLSAADLAARFDAAAMADARVSRLSGGPEQLFTTYVQRSALMGFPDYVSVRAVEVEGGAALAIWSRSRYGYRDMGVNRARVERWLAALAG